MTRPEMVAHGINVLWWGVLLWAIYVMVVQ